MSSTDKDVYDIIFTGGIVVQIRLFNKLQSPTLTICLGGVDPGALLSLPPQPQNQGQLPLAIGKWCLEIKDGVPII